MKVLEEVLNQYHGVDEEMADAIRRPISAKLDINTVCRIDAVSSILKETRQNTIDTLVAIGFEALIDSDKKLAKELQAAFLSAAQENLKDMKGGE